MDTFKTVEGYLGDNSDNISARDPLYTKQSEGVAKMRASLLSCSDDSITAKQAIQNITVLRVYHQITRIIKYIEMCDKIEEKMYESIDFTLDNSQSANPGTWMTLIEMQERLQKIMIDSYKMLQPYLDLSEVSAIDLSSASSTVSPTSLAANLDSTTRDKIRISAQAVLLELTSGGN